MSSTLAALPVAAKAPELQQAHWAAVGKGGIFFRSKKSRNQKAMHAARSLEMVKSHHSHSSSSILQPSHHHHHHHHHHQILNHDR